MVWAIDFHFNFTTYGKAIKIASMIEHSRCSLRAPSPPNGCGVDPCNVRIVEVVPV